MAKTKRTLGEHKCRVCSKVFSERTSLNHHTQLHRADRPFSCNLCTFTCKTKKYLQRHVNRVHSQKEKEIECEICGKKFLYKNQVVKHMYIHTNERPFKCEVCNKGFNSRYSLSSHRHVHTGAKPYKCSYCDYACRDNSTLRKHQERHTGVSRVYQCTACDKSYKTKSILKMHIEEVHMDLDVKTSPCAQCGKLFKSLKSLNNHIRMSHLKLYTCKCEICGVTLSSKYNMRAHLTSHIDYRPFKCSFEGCGKRYKDKAALKKHAIIHYPDKHFECSICKKKFSRLHRMHLHKKQHKAKKKCVFCDYCGKGFYNKNYIRFHITRKHMYKQHYICDLCNFKTYNKPSIVMHIKHGHVSEMDRKCKICKKTYKKHIYLKLHYWNTHSIKYKLNNHKYKRLKKKNKTTNTIIEESSESDTKEIELMHEVKVEALSDAEENKEGIEYSKGVLSEDVDRAMSHSAVTGPNTRFNDLFIEHVIMPTTSNGEVSETQQIETGIYVDVTCQKEAERIRTEMLNRWKGNMGVKPFVRLKRHNDGALKLNNVKSEKIENAVVAEDEGSHFPVWEVNLDRKNRKKKVNRKKKTRNRKVNDCDKINQIIENFNNLFSENIRENDDISKINQNISRVAEQVRNDLEKNSDHHKKQILKMLNRALTKYNKLVNKMNDIKNKEIPPIDDIINGEVMERNNKLVSIVDQHRQNSECHDEMTSLETSENICGITKGDDNLLSMGDEDGQNCGEMISLENDENSTGDMILNSLGDENVRNNMHRDNFNDFTASVNENISGDITKTGVDPASTVVTDCKKLNLEATSSENDENRSSYVIEKCADDLASIGNEYEEKSDGGEVVKSRDDQTLTSEENINCGDFMKLNDEINPAENDENRSSDVIEKCADDLASIGSVYEEKSDGGEVVKSRDDQTLTSEENINCGDFMIMNDEINSSENDEGKNENVSKIGENPGLIIGDENRRNSNIYKDLNDETSGIVTSKCDELFQKTEYQPLISDENRGNNETTTVDENIKNGSSDLGQVNIENLSQTVNPLNSSDNGILYESSLAELVKLRKRKSVKNVNINSNIGVSHDDDLVYISNLKEINKIIKEMDDMVSLIENDETLKNGNSGSRDIHSENNSEKSKKLVISTRKRRRKRGKRNDKVSKKSEINRPKKIKEIRNEVFEETNDEIASSNKNKLAPTENNEEARVENYETFINIQSESQENNEIPPENFLEERVNKYWTRRSVRNLHRKVNADVDSHDDCNSDDEMDQDFVPDYDDNEESGVEKNKSNKFKFNSHQCYICFKLYETKEKLLDHCKEHFDVCNLKMLKKCPFCEYVTKCDLVGHVRLKHKVNLKYLYGTLKDRKNNNNKSRFYFNVGKKSSLASEVEVIPSILNLNRQAVLEIDRKRREKNYKEVKKTKLVKKDGEWVVEKVVINTKKENYVLPDKIEELLKNNEKDPNNENDKNNDENKTGNNESSGNNEEDPENDESGDHNDGNEANNDDYCAKLQKLYRTAKKNGQKMLFPCNKCDKICQSLSALRLHLRRHDPNAKPFKKKVWKHKLSEEELKELQENKLLQKTKNITKNNKNRYEKPKPIVNKHKCDPKLKDFYEKNIKGGDIEFWQFLKIFNKMTRENVNDFSDLENRTEFGNHFIDPELNPPNNENSSNIGGLSSSKGSGSLKSKFTSKPTKGGSLKSNSKTLVGKNGVANKVLKTGIFKRTILISKKDSLRRKAIKDNLRKQNITKSNTIT